jgi:hypothetical protein
MMRCIYAEINMAEDMCGVPLEDKILQLCAEAIAAPQGDLDPILLDLQAALHEHVKQLRQLAAEALVGHSPSEMDTPAQL